MKNPLFRTYEPSDYRTFGLESSHRQEHIVFDRDMGVSSAEFEVIIADLACNKYPGLDSLTSEHMKYANSKLPVLLSILMPAVLTHGHVPRSAIRSVLDPIMKNTNKRITDKDNSITGQFVYQTCLLR